MRQHHFPLPVLWEMLVNFCLKEGACVISINSRGSDSVTRLWPQAIIEKLRSWICFGVCSRYEANPEANPLLATAPDSQQWGGCSEQLQPPAQADKTEDPNARISSKSQPTTSDPSQAAGDHQAQQDSNNPASPAANTPAGDTLLHPPSKVAAA